MRSEQSKLVSETVMKHVVLIVASALAGFGGGVAAPYMLHTDARNGAGRVVRAQTFELVDETGKAIAVWGVNKEGHTLLAFLGSESVPGEKKEHARELDEPLNQKAAVGVMGTTPFLLFRGTDGTTRMELNLTPWQKPVLVMADGSGPRVGLGVNQSDTPSGDDDDWALVFEPSRAAIGMSSLSEGGQRYVRGSCMFRMTESHFPKQSNLGTVTWGQTERFHSGSDLARLAWNEESGTFRLSLVSQRTCTQ